MRIASPLVALLLCLAVAGPCSGGESERPDGSPHDPGLRVRIATYNVWAIPLVSKRRNDRIRRLPAALRSLDLDVVCLQEVWMRSDQARIRRALRTIFPHAVAAGGGLMVLSRFPITASTFVPFPHYAGLDLGELLAGKGLLDVVLQTPRGALRVVTAHLALAFGPGNPRRRQLGFLLDRLERPRAQPLVLAADLNTWPVDEGILTTDYCLLIERGLIDAKPPVKRADGRWDPGPPTRIEWPRPPRKPKAGWYPDHLLFRSGAEADLALVAFDQALDERATALSDHNLLWADLTLSRATRPLAEAPPR